MRRAVVMLIVLLMVCDGVAQTVVPDVPTSTVDGVEAAAVVTHAEDVPVDSVNVESPHKDNIFKKFIKQLVGGNKDRTFERPIDFSFAILPSYSKEASFGIGGVITGLYRIDRTDSVMPPSDTQIFANISLTGQYSFIFKGNNLFKGNRSRLTYDLAFQNKPLDFWGISYDACAVNPKGSYTRRHIKLESDYLYKVIPGFHVGAALYMRYTYLSKISDISYLQGQQESYFFTGLGASVVYDTRDFIPNPQRGFYIMLRELVYPRPLGSAGQNIFSTTLIADYYQRMWKGSVLAIDLYGQYNGTDVPWPLRAELGAGGSRMRGYYGGRYIDNNMMTAQLELRQHIYKRVGATAWVGCGTVFPSFKELQASDFLINYGVGFRFEFKHNVNLRVDLGFGKDTYAVVFNMSEAF